MQRLSGLNGPYANLATVHLVALNMEPYAIIDYGQQLVALNRPYVFAPSQASGGGTSLWEEAGKVLRFVWPILVAQAQETAKSVASGASDAINDLESVEPEVPEVVP